MEDLSKEIDFLKSITPKDLEAIGKHSDESVKTYEFFKEDTDNFADTQWFGQIEEMGLTLQKWVGTVKKIMEVYPQDFEDNSEYDDEDEIIAPIITTSPKKPSVRKTTVKIEKSAAEKEEEKLAKKEATKQNNLQIKLAQKRAELAELQRIVRANATFKEQLATEMKAHLQTVGLAGLGSNITPELELIKLTEKIKFYKNLIKGDKDDFKAIAKRVGLDFRRSKPRKKPTETQQSLNGLKDHKSDKNLWEMFVEWFND